MAGELKLDKPWLVAVWPGMGHVAISAGYYLATKLGMHILAELSAHELFDVEHVEVKEGLIRTGRLPRSRFFAWKDPRGQNDIVVFIGDAQPPKGRYAFCHRLIEFARQLGVERVYTFAAMATPMHPEHTSRVFVAATDEESLAALKRLDLEILEDGRIGGLNGVLLGVAAESGLRVPACWARCRTSSPSSPFPRHRWPFSRPFPPSRTSRSISTSCPIKRRKSSRNLASSSRKSRRPWNNNRLIPRTSPPSSN